MKSQPTSRIAWIDNLRTFIIFLVVSIHACVTYSYIGGWYVNVPPGPSPVEQLVFILWQAHLQAFFMGLLFFLAGVFAHRALLRRGAKAFMQERFLRLGVPSLLYMLVIQPCIIYFLLHHPEGPDRPAFGYYWTNYVTSGQFLSGNGPMWFAIALLFFCAALTLWLNVFNRKYNALPASSAPPNAKKLLLFGSCLVVSSFLVRLFYPLGSSVFNMQLGFFSQYIAVFTFGVIADRQEWFESLVQSNSARRSGKFAILAGPVALILLVAAGGPPPQDGPIKYSGGWNPWAFGLAFWEQLTGLALGLGIMSWFYRKGTTSHPIARWLSDRSFGVYMLHSPIMVALTPLCQPIANMSRLVAADVLTIATLIGSLLVADMAKRIPFLKRML
jgi:glucan biosynthesis protein C